MATSGMLPPPPAEPEPWSEKDFAPITAFLRHQIGITLETHRMGLLQARLRSRLQVKGFKSFNNYIHLGLKEMMYRGRHVGLPQLIGLSKTLMMMTTIAQDILNLKLLWLYQNCPANVPMRCFVIYVSLALFVYVWRGDEDEG